MADDLSFGDPESDGIHSPLVDEVVESKRAGSSSDAIDLSAALLEMDTLYRIDPMKAVRGQGFIKTLHRYVGTQLESRLTKFARSRGIKVRHEVTVLGSTKPKDVDIAVVDPDNGPLMLIGVRSQMSSVANNVLTYYEGIVGECISLQDRFPMATHGYIYLHPLASIKKGKEEGKIDHVRYSRMYAAVTGRAGADYKNQRGIFDHFAYLIVDFNASPPKLRDDLISGGLSYDLSIHTFVDRMIDTFNSRTLFWDVFG